MTDNLEGVVGEIAVEARALSAKAKRLELALHRPDLLVKLLHVDVDPCLAGTAVKATLRAQPSDLAFELLAALRAGNADLLIIEKAFGHGEGSSGCCGDSSEPRPAESRESRPGGADGGPPGGLTLATFGQLSGSPVEPRLPSPGAPASAPGPDRTSDNGGSDAG